MNDQTKIAASILSADFTRLGEQVNRAAAAGADYIHVDVMDGRFVPNLTIGPLVVQAVAGCTTTPLDVHLMIEEPERYLDEFAEPKPAIITIHLEATRALRRTLTEIRSRGIRAGVSLRPGTPVSSVEDIVDLIDLLLIMTVEPGFGGQTFIEAMVPKIQRARRLLDAAQSSAELEVDGGINTRTLAQALGAGAGVLVAGSAVFANDAIEDNIKQLRAAITKARSVRPPD